MALFRAQWNQCTLESILYGDKGLCEKHTWDLKSPTFGSHSVARVGGLVQTPHVSVMKAHTVVRSRDVLIFHTYNSHLKHSLSHTLCLIFFIHGRNRHWILKCFYVRLFTSTRMWSLQSLQNAIRIEKTAKIKMSQPLSLLLWKLCRVVAVKLHAFYIQPDKRSLKGRFSCGSKELRFFVVGHFSQCLLKCFGKIRKLKSVIRKSIPATGRRSP
jgi:hypothetical protein